MAVALTVEEIAAAVGGTAYGAGSVVGVSTDTRTLESGQLFVALKGENFNGHAYLNQAAEKGAAAFLLERKVGITEPQLPAVVVADTTQAYGDLARSVRDRFAGPVVGITGSVGKTTAKEMVAAALGARFTVHKTPENFNNEIGLPQTIFSRPDAADALVLEMGMRGAGQIARLCRIGAPKIGIVTNVGLSHVELLGSRAAIAAAKAELLESLPADGLAVFPATDDYAATLRAASKAPVVTCALESSAEVCAERLVSTDGGWKANVTTPWGASELFVPSPGRFNVLNALFAIAVGGHLGIGLDALVAALGGFAPAAMRLETLKTPGGATVLSDCYNAAPDSMVGALETLMQTPVGTGGARIAVLGEMRELGGHAAEAHKLVGKAVARLKPDMLVLIGEATRTLSAAAIVDGFRTDAIHYFDKTAAAAELLPLIVQPTDAVLVKGSRALALEAIVAALVPGAGAHP